MEVIWPSKRLIIDISQHINWIPFITFVVGNFQNCKFPCDHFAQIEFQDAALVGENCQFHLYLHIEGLPTADRALGFSFITAFAIFLETSNTAIFFIGNI